MALLILSILICSLYNRATLLGRIMNQLSQQINNFDLAEKVEIIPCTDNGSMTIGRKRNALIDAANGDWVCFIDDDDHVSDSYLHQIVSALEDKKPDCIGLIGMILWKGFWREFEHSIRHAEYATLPGPRFVRPPNHLNPVRRSIAEQIKFPELDRGEDTAYSLALRDSKLIKTEVFIDEPLYFYTPSQKEEREAPRR